MVSSKCRGQAQILSPATYLGGSKWRSSSVFLTRLSLTLVVAVSHNSSQRRRIGMAAGAVGALWRAPLKRLADRRFARCQAASGCESRVDGSAKITCVSRVRARGGRRLIARFATGGTAGMSPNSRQLGRISRSCIDAHALSAASVRCLRCAAIASALSGRCGCSRSSLAPGVAQGSRLMRRHAVVQSTWITTIPAVRARHRVGCVFAACSALVAMCGSVRSNPSIATCSSAIWPISGLI